MKRVTLKRKITPKRESAIKSAASKNVNANMLCEKAVLASLSILVWSGRKHDKKVSKEVDERHGAIDAGRYNKVLMDNQYIKDIRNNAQKCRLEHYTLTKPWMDEGPRVLPTELLVRHSAMVKEAREQHLELVEELYRAWPKMINEAKEKLNGLFNASDYPSQKTIRSKFSFELKLLPIPAAGDFRINVGNAQMKHIKADLEEHMREVMVNGNHDTRDRILEVVGAMAEKLRAFSPDAEDRAERGIFHSSLVQNVRDLVDILPAFNMSKDKKLQSLIDRMARELCEDEASSLRENDGLRDSVATAAEDILADVEKYFG